MKLTVLQKDLSPMLNVVSRFVSPRAQLPILSNIKLVAKGTKLVLIATNLEMSISANIGANIEKEGEISVPAKTFTDLVNSIHSEQLDLSLEGETIKVEAENVKTEVAGINTSEFPEIPDTPMGIKFEIDKDSLEKALSQVLFSTSPDDTRPALAGVLVNFESGISFVSSDGFRLSRKKVTKSEVREIDSLILPKSTTRELSKLVSQTKGDISFYYQKEENQFFIQMEKMLITSRVIDGEYPKYEKIIPSTHKVKLSFSKNELLSSVKTAAVIARDASNIVTLQVESSKFKIITESPHSGRGELEVPAKIDGDNVSINYNYRYIEEFLSAIDGDDVVIELIDASTAGVFRDSSDPDYLHLIMPVRG